MSEKKKAIKDVFQNYMKDPEGNKDKLLACLNNYKDNWLQERRTTQDRIWRNSAAFYSGNHYVRDSGTSTSSYRVKLRENHTNNIINRMVSIFTQNMPITRVFPSSDSSEDIQDAETTETYCKYFWRTKKLEQKLGKLLKYSAIFGNGFIYTSYDPNLGDKIILGAEDTDSGRKEVKEYQGDVKINIDDPLKICVRPGIDEMDDMYDFIRSVPASRADLEALYGKIDAESPTGENMYNGQMRQDDDLVMQHHYYHKPTPWFEEGMYVCWVGKSLLKVRPSSESEKELPLIHLPFDKAPIRFWGISSIEQVMDLQEQLDRAASMIVEARNLVARPRVMAPHECNVPGQSLTDRPGEIIRYKGAGGFKPSFEVPNFNFAEMANHKADLRNALAQVVGITGASRGEIPAATKTALALQLVLEQDRSQFLPFIKSFHQSILDMMNRVLGIAAEYFDPNDPRVIKIEGSVVTTRTFHGGVIPSPLDMYLEDTNPLGWTAAGRAERIESLIQHGVLTDRNQILEMLRINSPDPAFEFEKISRQAQQKENELLKQGQMVELGPEDDDNIHLEEISKVMASFSFRDTPQAVKDVFKAHSDAHKARLQQFSAPAQGAQGPTPKSGNITPQMAANQVAAPIPGGNIEQLLTSARAG